MEKQLTQNWAALHIKETLKEEESALELLQAQKKVARLNVGAEEYSRLLRQIRYQKGVVAGLKTALENLEFAFTKYA